MIDEISKELTPKDKNTKNWKEILNHNLDEIEVFLL